MALRRKKRKRILKKRSARFEYVIFIDPSNLLT